MPNKPTMHTNQKLNDMSNTKPPTTTEFIHNVNICECGAELPTSNELHQKWGDERDLSKPLHHLNSPILTHKDAAIISDWMRRERAKHIVYGDIYIDGNLIPPNDAVISAGDFKTIDRAYTPPALIEPIELEITLSPPINGNAHQRRKTHRAQLRQLDQFVKLLESTNGLI